MDFLANLHVSPDGALYSFAYWRPGSLRCDDGVLTFVPRGDTRCDELPVAEISAVWLTTNVIGADDVRVSTRSGVAWRILVNGGRRLAAMLRARGVSVTHV